MNRDPRTVALKAVGFFIVYVATSRLLQGNYVFSQAVLWLPTGVAVAGLWLLGARYWPVVFLGTLTQRLLAHYTFPSMLPGLVGNTLEALTAVAVLRHLEFRSDFRRLRDVRALAAAAVIAPAVGATFALIAWVMYPDSFPVLSKWAGWWRMNGLGILVVLPLAAAWAASPPRRPRAGTVLESAALTLAVLALVGFLTKLDVTDGQSGMVLSYLALPVTLYAAVRFGARGAATAAAAVVVLLTMGTGNAIGPFVAPPSVHGPSHVRELALQAVIAIMTISPVLLAAVLSEREAALAGVASEREQRQELLASIDRNLSEGLFRSLPGKGLVYVNSGLARMLGYDTQQELHGVATSTLVADAAAYQFIRDRLRERGRVHNAEVMLVRKDRTLLPALVSCTSVRAADGTPLYVDGAVSDITAHKRLEDQLRQSQKMEALGQLAGGVAHDFNNLLTAIGGYAEALRDGFEDGSQRRRDADEILHASRRAAGLTRQLLAYSRRQQLEAQVVDLREVVEHMSGMLRRLIGENIVFETRRPDAPVCVRVDRGQLEQVLLNLVVNARDAMPDGGTLTITTSRLALDTTHPHAEADTVPGPHACLSVEDSGVGMDQATRDRAFDPFFTTKGPGRGTGLGLSTVFGIVRQSGGLVWIESQPGRGACVRVCLPEVAGVPAPEPRRPAAARSSSGGETVLVVEDEATVRDLIARTLRASGYRVLVAEDGERGLVMARDLGSHIDLLLTDVIMPHMGGRELADRLTHDRPGLPVLFVSGYTNEGDEKLDLVGPGRGFLQKPFAPSALLQRVREQLASSVLPGA